MPWPREVHNKNQANKMACFRRFWVKECLESFRNHFSDEKCYLYRSTRPGLNSSMRIRNGMASYAAAPRNTPSFFQNSLKYGVTRRASGSSPGMKTRV